PLTTTQGTSQAKSRNVGRSSVGGGPHMSVAVVVVVLVVLVVLVVVVTPRCWVHCRDCTRQSCRQPAHPGVANRINTSHCSPLSRYMRAPTCRNCAGCQFSVAAPAGSPGTPSALSSASPAAPWPARD